MGDFDHVDRGYFYGRSYEGIKTSSWSKAVFTTGMLSLVAFGLILGYALASTTPKTEAQIESKDLSEAVKFVNEIVRPLSESIRNQDVEIDAALITWFGGMDMMIPNTADIVDDGREDASDLTGLDVNATMAMFQARQASSVGKKQVISKPTVKRLRVQD